MKTMPFAGLIGLATLGAQAQMIPTSLTRSFDPVVVTATRGIVAGTTLRDATVITREDLEAAGALSLGEVLQRHAGIELRATGGPGQPQGLFIRGAGTAQTLVLIDGLRAGSATIGTTSIENIPIELIERIEVVKGPLSSLYGSEAIGGVVQIFTRGRGVPHLFATAAYGSDNDARLAAGVSAVDGGTAMALSVGARKVDAPSATSERVAFCHDPDDDPHENLFANVRVSQRLWQGETIAFEAFGTRGRTEFDGCGSGDRNDQTIAGARLTSSANFAPWWASRLALGQGRDRLVIRGAFADRFETRQDQASWINEFTVPGGNVVLGAETVRQKVVNNPEGTVFARTRRDTDSVFVGLNEAWGTQRLEASARHDRDDAFGKRNTGSLGYAMQYGNIGRLSATFARGFRAPTFFDLYGPTSDFYQPNPDLQPERSRSREATLRAAPGAPIAWRITAFDNRIEDLIIYVFPTVQNVRRARIRGVELSAEGRAWAWRWHAALTAQRPRDEDTGLQLQNRAERFGSLGASRAFGAWTAGVTLTASGARFDSSDANPESRLAAYVLVDARVRYALNKHVSLEIAATNLTDKRFETARGYPGAGRGLLASLRFEAF